MKTSTLNIEMFLTTIKFKTDLGDEYEDQYIDSGDYGCTVKDDPIVIYIRKIDDVRTLVHEVYHAVQTILSTRHIECEETGAHLMDYIIGEYCRRFKLGLITNYVKETIN